MSKQRHSPLYCSFDSPCIVCRMFSFSVMGITTVLYRAFYIPHGGSRPLKMHCALRSVSFCSHITPHTHAVHIPLHATRYTCVHKVREFCCQAHNNPATGTQCGALLQFEVKCLRMNAKCLTDKLWHFTYSLSRGAVRDSDYIAPNVSKISKYNEPLFYTRLFYAFFALTRLANSHHSLIWAFSFSV
jgi:hypothetical protein